jgi:hypothetical protein
VTVAGPNISTTTRNHGLLNAFGRDVVIPDSRRSYFGNYFLSSVDAMESVVEQSADRVTFDLSRRTSRINSEMPSDVIWR